MLSSKLARRSRISSKSSSVANGFILGCLRVGLVSELHEEGSLVDQQPSYVGNKIAVFVLQSLGCDVAALNTVQFSKFLLLGLDTSHTKRILGNHTGYGQWKGTKLSAQDITDLYEGLKQSFLNDFDMMLSGYIPGAEAVVAVGNIAKELKEKTKEDPGAFFWVLDPVMGDNGRIYVAEDVVPAYKALIPYADLILPNQFEAEYVHTYQLYEVAFPNQYF